MGIGDNQYMNQQFGFILFILKYDPNNSLSICKAIIGLYKDLLPKEQKIVPSVKSILIFFIKVCFINFYL